MRTKRELVQWVRWVVWLWLLASATAVAFAQHYSILPVPGSSHDIFTLMQDSHSAIWVGTADDVLRFDGKNFYSIRPYGFPQEMPTNLAEDGDGGIWIATRNAAANGKTGPGGLYRYQRGKVEKIATGGFISLVQVDTETMLATEYKEDPSYWDIYVIRKSGEGWRATRALEHGAKFLTVDHQGTVLFPCPAGRCELTQQQIHNWPEVPLHPRLTPMNTEDLLLRVVRDRYDCLWFRGEVAVSYQCPGQPTAMVPPEIAGDDPFAYVGESADGSVLMLSNDVVLGRPGTLHVARANNGLPGGTRTALPARDGTIFLGTSNGLYRFMYPFRLESWNEEHGVDSPYFIRRIGDQVFAANNGIQKLDSTRANWVPWVTSKQVGTAVHLIPGPDHTIYAASLIRGATQFSADGKMLMTTPWGRGGARLASDTHGHTWLGGAGVTLLEHKGNKLNYVAQGTSNDTSLDMEYDSKREALWACLNHEVVVMQDGRWQHITEKDGLLNDACRSIAVLADGDVWIGYSQFTDLSRIRRNSSGGWQVNSFHTESKTQDPDFTFLDSDSRGWLWRAVNHKDYVATPDGATRGDWLLLDREDGIPNPGGNQNSFFGDSDGSIWFASDNSIVHFTPPDDFATRFPTPQVFVAGFSLDQGLPVAAEAAGEIQHGVDVVAHVGSLQFDRRNALRVRYRLMPGQTDWTESSSLDIPVGKLRWGNYTLQVQGRLASGLWSPTAEQVFRVALPIWLSWPVLTIVGAFGTAFGVGTVQWKKRQRFKQDVVLPDLTAWRMGALSPETEHLIGTTIDGRYEIGHVLSVGGFATVVRARDLQKDGKLCAVKIFRYDLGDRDWIRYRFQHEVAALEQLSHPNIVKITGHGTIDTGAPYLVMEFIQGSSLREVLGWGAMPRLRIARMLAHVTSALALLHRASIYHRDLKPENLMIRSDASGDEQIVLIDFSIAIVKSPDETFHGISRVAGTIGYMAPEQVTGYADASTDIHSLAKVLIEMMSGQQCADLLPEATLDLPKHIRGYFTENPGTLKADSIDMIASALAFDPGYRPKDVEAFSKPIIRDLESGS